MVHHRNWALDVQVISEQVGPPEMKCAWHTGVWACLGTHQSNHQLFGYNSPQDYAEEHITYINEQKVTGVEETAAI